MPNWDRICVRCGSHGSYLDFYPQDATDPSDQRCIEPDRDGPRGLCGGRVQWEDQGEMDAESAGKSLLAIVEAAEAFLASRSPAEIGDSVLMSALSDATVAGRRTLQEIEDTDYDGDDVADEEFFDDDEDEEEDDEDDDEE